MDLQKVSPELLGRLLFCAVIRSSVGRGIPPFSDLHICVAMRLRGFVLQSIKRNFALALLSLGKSLMVSGAW